VEKARLLGNGLQHPLGQVDHPGLVGLGVLLTDPLIPTVTGWAEL